MEKIIYIAAILLTAGSAYASSDHNELRNFETFLKAKNYSYQIQNIEKYDAMIASGYYPFMLLFREPMVLYVNREKWNARINNFKEYIAEAKKGELVYGIFAEKDRHYYSAIYLSNIYKLNIKFKNKNKLELSKFLDEIDVIVAGLGYSQNVKLKPIATLSNKRYQVIKYQFPLNRSVTFVAPTIGETDKKGVEYTIPHILYLKESVTLQRNKETEDQIKLFANRGDSSSEHITGDKLTRFIENYKKRISNLEH